MKGESTVECPYVSFDVHIIISFDVHIIIINMLPSSSACAARTCQADLEEYSRLRGDSPLPEERDSPSPWRWTFACCI